MNLLRILTIFFIIFLCLSCSDDKTEILLKIESNIPDSSAPDKMVVKGVIEEETRFEKSYNVTDKDFPFNILVTSEDDIEYTIRFEVYAYRAGVLVAEAKTEKRFVRHRREYVTVVLGILNNDGGLDTNIDAYEIQGDAYCEDSADIEDVSDNEIVDTAGDISLDLGSDAVIEECPYGYRDCNNNKEDGCETNILSDKNNCGECNKICNLDNATSECRDGVCVIVKCSSGFENCDSKDDNGCEVNLAKDPHHCGDCVTDCGENSLCNNKACECKTGYANCDKLWGNGCEKNIFEDDNNCGECNKVCPYKTHCLEGRCVCDEGYGDCNLIESDGCEVDLNTDPMHCGDCKNKCEPKNVKKALCNNKTCDYDECLLMYRDADRDRTNGCEEWTYFPKIYQTGNLSNFIYYIFPYNNSYYISLITYNNTTKEFTTIIFKTDLNGDIIWAKSLNQLVSPDRIIEVNSKLFMIGSLMQNNIITVAILSFSEEGELYKSYYIDTDKEINIKGISAKDGKIYLAGDIKIDNFRNDGLLIVIDTEGNNIAKKYYITGSQNVTFSLEEVIFTSNRIYAISNLNINQFPSTIKKGYLLKLSDSLGIENSYTSSGENKISFEHIDVNSFGRLILSGTQYQAISNSYDAGMIFKILEYNQSFSIEKQRLFSLNNRNTHFRKFTTSNDMMFLNSSSFIVENHFIKDLIFHLIKLNQDLIINKGKSFYSDIMSGYSSFGYLNLLISPLSGILTNVYNVIPDKPVNSEIVYFDENLDIKFNCPNEYLYDVNLTETDSDINLIKADISVEDLSVNISELPVNLTEYSNIVSITHCKEY